MKDLEALTNIDSGNGDREGTEAANKFVAEKMTAIGATTEFRYNDRACHLISRLKEQANTRFCLLPMLIQYLKRVKLHVVRSMLTKITLPGDRA